MTIKLKANKREIRNRNRETILKSFKISKNFYSFEEFIETRRFGKYTCTNILFKSLQIEKYSMELPSENTGKLIKLDENTGKLIILDENTGKLIKLDENTGKLIILDENTGKLIILDENTGKLIILDENTGKLVK